MRAHWAIENALPWPLDVSFREDAARNRKDNGPANLAILRRRALDVVRRDTSKGSLSIKLKRAGSHYTTPVGFAGFGVMRRHDAMAPVGSDLRRFRIWSKPVLNQDLA